jgi:cytoskeleton protein RodZ
MAQEMDMFEGAGPRGAAPPPVEMPQSETGDQLGGILRRARESRGWSLEDIAGETKIRRHYLDAIEKGRYHDLPAPIYARNFVRTYARLVGIIPDAAAEMYEQEISGLVARSEPDRRVSPDKSRIPGPRPLLAALAIAASIYTIYWYVNRDEAPDSPAAEEAEAETIPAPDMIVADEAEIPVMAGSDAIPAGEVELSAPEAPAEAEVPAPAESESPPPLSFQPQPAVEDAADGDTPVPPRANGRGTAEAAVAAANAVASAPETGSRIFSGIDSGGRVVVRAVEESWINVEDADGTKIFDGVLRPGESYEAPDKPGITLLTDNAGGVEVVLDGKVLPGLGARGEIRRDYPLDPAKLAAELPQ